MNHKDPHILLPAHGSFSDFLHAAPGHFPHAIRPSVDIATPLFYSNTTSSTQSLWKVWNTTHHQKGKRLQRQAKEASFVCKTVARFGLSAAASPGGDVAPPPNLPYFIPSSLNRHLEKVGQTCEKLYCEGVG